MKHALSSAIQLASSAAAASMAYRKRRATGRAHGHVVKRRRVVKTRKTVKRRLVRRRPLKARKREIADQLGDASLEAIKGGKAQKLTLRGLKREVEKGMERLVVGYESYGPWGATTGSIFLQNTSTTPTTGTLNVPMHMWEMTSCTQLINGVYAVPNMLVQPQWTDPTATGVMSYVNSGPQVQYDLPTTVTNQLNTPGNYGRLVSMNIKLLFYATSTLPTRILVQLVRFTDARFVPDNIQLASSTEAGVINSAYESYLKPFTANPISIGTRSPNNYMKVLKSTEFIMDPKESTDNSAIKTRQVNIFYKYDKDVCFKWQNNQRINVEGTGTVSAAVESNIDQQTSPHFKGRVFLIIRAQAKTNPSASATVHPSYDICIRNNWKINN